MTCPEVVLSLGSDSVPDSQPPHRISVAFPNSGSHSDFSLHLEHCVLVVFKTGKPVFILKGKPRGVNQAPFSSTLIQVLDRVHFLDIERLKPLDLETTSPQTVPE